MTIDVKTLRNAVKEDHHEKQEKREDQHKERNMH